MTEIRIRKMGWKKNQKKTLSAKVLFSEGKYGEKWS